MTTIALEHVTFDFDGPVRALDDLDLVVPAGQVVALVGSNGSGKTTLLLHLDGLLRPTAGRVLLDGLDAASRRVAELARIVAVGSADPGRQIFGRTVLAEVAFGPHQLGHPRETADRLARDALAAVGLADDAAVHPGDLGAARRKLLVIAATAAMGTPVVAVDEPTAGLDMQARQLARAVVDRLRAEGRTVILAGHDLRFLAAVADRVVRLDDGRIVADGDPAAILS